MTNTPLGGAPAPAEVSVPETSLRRVAIDPISRVEGHGKVTLLLDKDNQVAQARLHIVEFRGFERFIQGRPYWEVPMVVQRLCGICPVSHHLAAAKALDMLVGAPRLDAAAEKTRRLLHYGQVLQSHALHFFHLSSPDLIFGDSVSPAKRNVIELLSSHPDIALKGVKLRKFGQTIIESISGKRVHGSIAIPGGVNRTLNQSQIAELSSQLDEVRSWFDDAIGLAKQLYLSDPALQQFAVVDSPLLSMVDLNGNFELYHGNLRASTDQGDRIIDQLDYCDYASHIQEQVKSWSFMKFPFFSQLGHERGWYRVGPLARVMNCDQMGLPRAEAARLEFLEHCSPGGQSSLLYHWARMIEMLYCAEAIEQLLNDSELSKPAILSGPGERQSECYGVIEAPRGTLIHHYLIGEDDLVKKANLIVSTTSNNQAMNEAIRHVCRQELDGHALTEHLLNRVEMAIRAYDPCLSCATHALGQMPLQLEVLDSNGQRLSSAGRSSIGGFTVNTV